MIKFIKKEPYIKFLQKKNFSLFVILHGYGADENDLFFIANKIPNNFLVISLRAIYPLQNGGFYWYDISLSSNKLHINKKQALKSLEEIILIIKNIIKYYNIINPDIWLCGFSQGAMLSYSIALKYPNIINKVIILSGFIYNKILPNNISIIKKLTFFITHGKYDNIIPIKLARKGLELLNNLNIKDIFYKEYESEHTISILNFEDLVNWIFIKNKIK